MPTTTQSRWRNLTEVVRERLIGLWIRISRDSGDEQQSVILQHELNHVCVKAKNGKGSRQTTPAEALPHPSLSQMIYLFWCTDHPEGGKDFHSYTRTCNAQFISFVLLLSCNQNDALPASNWQFAVA